MDTQSPKKRKGRGALSNADGRYEQHSSRADDDGWGILEEDELPPLHTHVQEDKSRSIIVRNQSPDLPFDRSINPYRGCEHGCIYCFARPSHAYLGLSPGLDFETRLFFKPRAGELLRRELAKPSYRCQVMALGTNTDPYQPIERHHRVMRSILEVLAETRHPVGITTKGAMVVRDIDLLADMAHENLAFVSISLTTLDTELAQLLEPRASAPQRRLEAMRKLTAVGVPVHASLAPIIPALNDSEIEALLEAAAEAGALTASWMLVRLPREVKDLFREWLDEHYSERAKRVMERIREARGGRDDDPRFWHRFRPRGIYVDTLNQRFAVRATQLGLNRRLPPLDTTRFNPPSPPTPVADPRQASLFD